MSLPTVKGSVRQVWMSPKDDLNTKANHYFGKAKTSIFVASYTPIGGGVSQGLCRAFDREVAVQVVIDAGPADRHTYRVPYPYKRVIIDGGSMHQKFALIDGKLVLIGTWNFSSSQKGHNTLLLLSGPKVVQPFVREAKRLTRLPDAPKLLRGDDANELVEKAAAKKGGWDKFLTNVARRVRKRGWLTVREEAALRRTIG